MVELKLESYADGLLPKDCFLSVRIGESQKLAALANDRVFKFPQMSERRIGKVELFRRIGSCSIDVDPSNPFKREVDVDCKDAGFGKVGLKFAVGGNDNSAPKKEEEKETGGKRAGKMKAARDYLNRHGLEAHLSDAMQLVLRERPENPVRAFAEKLLLAADAGDKLPPIDGGKPTEEGPPMPASRVQQTAPEEPPKQVTPKNRPAQLEPIAGKSTATRAPVTIVPFNAYYAEHFRSCAPAAMSKVHSLFGAKEVKAKPENKAVASVLPFADYYKANFKVVRAKPENKAVTSVLPFADYCKANFKACSPQAMGRFHSLFPAQAKPAPKALESAAPKASEPPASSMKETENAKRPSVGTWLCSLPVAQLRKAAPKAIEPAVSAPEQKRWVHKASVGTWLAHTLVEDPQAPPAPPAAAPAAPQPVASQAKVIASPQLPSSTGPKAMLLPSVGTWVSRPQPVKKVEPSYQFRPSVGSWLVAPTYTIEEDTKPASKKTAVVPSTMLLGASFASCGIRPTVAFL
mmetsp:Transcript_52696/g.97548  ORF Transcript_52696/g.97548 Transcript_52696/m.97548 type:complete len:519 (-) Transcript_52696:22-1578(-)